jgi:PiT family inorganic phosphate transporter
MESLFILLIITISACYLYAFISGFTDAGQAIASAIGTRSLSPTAAIFMAGCLEIAGALTGTAVALTIGKGIVSLELVSLLTVPAAIFGALAWSLFTYYFGIPVSETHGLIGGIIGAAIASAGTINAVNWGALSKIFIAMIAAPTLGFLGGFLLMGAIYRCFHSAPARKTTLIFKNLQRLSAAYLAFSHGQNDAQKPMGILVMALALYFGWRDPNVPIWVILTVGTVAGLGMAYGGWRIIKTLGMRITPLKPHQGFVSDFSAAIVLQIASLLGIPVSTTQVDASAVMGVGAARRFSSVRWRIVLNIFLSWVFTLPATIFFGWLIAKLLSFIFLSQL